jgi:Phage Mu protein F like protein
VTQPPLWDGDGIDPWLPQRLAAQADIAAAERRMYAHWWGSFSDWLTRVHRNVIAPAGTPDPYGVYTANPMWAAEMTAFVAGPVRDTVGLAFRQLFGADYLFDARPAVTAYLAEVRNLMVRTPDDVFSVIVADVARGAAAGDSIPTVAARIDALLSSNNAVENWAGRAVTIARTETVGALNAGRSDSFAAMNEQLGGGLEQMWLATFDSRTRLDHAEADGQRVAVGQRFLVGGDLLAYPGDKAGAARNTINCRCTTLLVRPGEELDMSDRGWPSDLVWDGDMAVHHPRKGARQWALAGAV